MSIIIDRRLNAGKKSTVNRQRFLQRHHKVIHKAVQDALSQRSITDIDRGDNIRIPRKDLSEPVFHHGSGGRSEQVHPGNRQFHAGDRIKRPPGGGGQGTGDGDASNQGEGEDQFAFEISRDEFLDYLFDELELPNLVRKELKDATEFRMHRAGFTTKGSPERLNIVRSLRAAHARRIALSGKERKQIRELKRQLRELQVNPDCNDPEREEELRLEIQALNRRLRRMPFIDEFDLRYNSFTKLPLPSSKAVMFCLMDVSGSMTQSIKEIAKRFFLLLYLFLQRNYEAVEVVFIRHHTEARECNEQDFFFSRETGGTVVSSALKLASEIIAERFPPEKWNIYIAQASDGDNWREDIDRCREILSDQLLPLCRYFAYVEIAEAPQALWHTYQLLGQENEHFASQRIRSQQDIYPVFRRLFAKHPSSLAALRGFGYG
ncbi:YeaH/YhbH family protein [Spongorhabdus nitratireducens]